MSCSATAAASTRPAFAPSRTSRAARAGRLTRARPTPAPRADRSLPARPRRRAAVPGGRGADRLGRTDWCGGFATTRSSRARSARTRWERRHAGRGAGQADHPAPAAEAVGGSCDAGRALRRRGGGRGVGRGFERARRARARARARDREREGARERPPNPRRPMAAVSIDPTAVRARFSSLAGGFAFLDAPGGSQVPDSVGDAIARCLREASANMGASYETSRRVGAIVAEAEVKAAAFLGCEPSEIIFGPNMTSLDFTLSRTAGREFAAGDEILVSSLDHDGGVAPWLELAHDKGSAPSSTSNCTTTRRSTTTTSPAKLTERTRVVAFAGPQTRSARSSTRRASASWPTALGALAWVDAVHYAAHEPIDVARDRRRRAALLALQVLRAVPGSPTVARRCWSPGVRTRRARRRRARSAVASRPAPFPTSCSPASTRRSTTWRRSAAWRRSCPTSEASASGFSRRCPTASPVYGLPTLEGRVPTFLVNVAGVPAGEVATHAR